MGALPDLRIWPKPLDSRWMFGTPRFTGLKALNTLNTGQSAFGQNSTRDWSKAVVLTIRGEWPSETHSSGRGDYPERRPDDGARKWHPLGPSSTSPAAITTASARTGATDALPDCSTGFPSPTRSIGGPLHDHAGARRVVTEKPLAAVGGLERIAVRRMLVIQRRTSRTKP